MRPTPDEVRINLRYTVFSGPTIAFNSGQTMDEFWSSVVNAEVEALRAYLRNCFHLSDMPVLEVS